MWFVCQADDSHRMSNIISSEKYKKKKKTCFETVVCQLSLALKGLTYLYNILQYIMDLMVSMTS